MPPKALNLASSLLALIGLADAAYLTFEHYQGAIPPCTVGGCERVLTSAYATVGGVPIAAIGLFYYLTLLILSRITGRWALLARFILVTTGLLISAGLVYLQLGVIRAICLYCITSAATTLLIWTSTVAEMQQTKGATHAN